MTAYTEQPVECPECECQGKVRIGFNKRRRQLTYTCSCKCFTTVDCDNAELAISQFNLCIESDGDYCGDDD